MFLLLLRCAVIFLLSLSSASPPSEPSDELAELALQGFDSVALDRSFSYHLHHCPYHLHLLRTQLTCGLELSDCLHGWAIWS
uniref:Secreted protein n=1 Tax=Poecilia reticulata TaxID=8081 RepID=A0A3P9NHS4_POERE